MVIAIKTGSSSWLTAKPFPWLSQAGVWAGFWLYFFTSGVEVETCHPFLFTLTVWQKATKNYLFPNPVSSWSGWLWDVHVRYKSLQSHTVCKMNTVEMSGHTTGLHNIPLNATVMGENVYRNNLSFSCHPENVFLQVPESLVWHVKIIFACLFYGTGPLFLSCLVSFVDLMNKMKNNLASSFHPFELSAVCHCPLIYVRVFNFITLCFSLLLPFPLFHLFCTVPLLLVLFFNVDVHPPVGTAVWLRFHLCPLPASPRLHQTQWWTNCTKKSSTICSVPTLLFLL